MTLSRRAFLLGSQSPPQLNAVALAGDKCLALAGVVCRNCGDACDARAIGFSYSFAGVPRPVVDPARCTECGECVPVCPA